MPMARSRVVTTLSSSLASTKIVNVGGSIGTIYRGSHHGGDGKTGSGAGNGTAGHDICEGERREKATFWVVNHPKLTPLLVALTTFNGVSQNYLYGEGTTLHLTGEIRLKGTSPVQIEIRCIDRHADAG